MVQGIDGSIPLSGSIELFTVLARFHNCATQAIRFTILSIGRCV